MPAGSDRRGFLRLVSTALAALAGVVARPWTGAAMQRPAAPRITPNVAAVATPTVKLSDAAVKQALPEKSWLSFFRNFMTRSGNWRGHPTEARPLARRQGRIAAIGPEQGPVGEMLGIGNIRDVGDGIACSTNVCEAQGVIARSTCTSLSCGKNSCADLKCDSDQCGAQSCAKHSCTSHSMNLTDVAAELTANWDTPLVRELRQQFGTDSTTALARAVASFVQRNGYSVR
jgi:hypothetical protein